VPERTKDVLGSALIDSFPALSAWGLKTDSNYEFNFAQTKDRGAALIYPEDIFQVLELSALTLDPIEAGDIYTAVEGLENRLLDAAGPGRELALYCSRGGMRSASLAWLCGTLGLAAHLLDGGYKAFRRHVPQCFDRRYTLLVLGGRTGSGKTDVLHRLAGLGAQMVDLEGLARHRGSVFGALDGHPQPTCEHFENLLAVALEQCDSSRSIWVEDESENLGGVNLPGPFLRQLRAAPVLVLQTEREIRLKRVITEYGALPRERMAQCLDRIKKRLGGLDHKQGHAFLAQGDLPGVAGILLEYYDRAYARQLSERRVAGTVAFASAEAAAEQLLRLERATFENA
jgi:tRNA 2-selenouridine synthase